MFSDSQAYGYQTRYGPKIDELEKMKEVAGEFYLGMSEEIVFDEKKDMKPFRNLQIYLVARQVTCFSSTLLVYLVFAAVICVLAHI
jgi:uncharacterized protein YydD (DUF2326 family)